jgi:hypothetical protein
MEKWGRRGLEVAGNNLDKVVDICREWECRMTLVVYPWPENVAAGDRDSIQVRHWRAWAAARGVRFEVLPLLPRAGRRGAAQVFHRR